MKTWICAYCQTANPENRKDCLACGAPAEETLQSSAETQQSAVKQADPLRLDMDPEKAAQVLRSVEKPLNQGRQVYYVLWRTLGEAFAIATASFIFGVAGTATGMTGWAFPAALLVGFLVGRNVTPYWTVSAGIFSAAVFGALVGLPFWFFGLSSKSLFISSAVLTIFCSLGTAHGALPFRQAGWWDRIRPFIGMLGALVFVGLGSALAWIVIGLAQAILQAIPALVK